MKGVILGLLLSASALQAQSLEAVLQSEAPRRPVIRFRMEDARVTGRLVALAQGNATLETGSGSRAVPLSSVDSLWVRHRSTGTGAVVGGIVGGAAGAVFVGLIAAAVCETDCENIGLKGAAVGFGLGGAGGILVGAAIGAAIPRWRLRFP